MAGSAKCTKGDREKNDLMHAQCLTDCGCWSHRDPRLQALRLKTLLEGK